MQPKNTIFPMIALILSLLFVPAAQLDVQAQAPAPAYVDLDAVQLDQLVAPIALDPDSLIAQILTASTYPDQVGAADTWLNQNMNLPPDQRAAGANGMSWDPAVKGLIEFPSALENLARNAAWASQLGNAYYNQPGDVMNAIQAMRLQAEQSNVLVTTAQQRVVVEAGLIEIVPVAPAVIYVPYYNPWQIWGTLFVAYPGFVVLPPPPGIVVATGLAFDPGIPVGVYAAYGWGFGAWAPAWDGGTVLFNHSTYISNSVTVCNHGYFGGHDRGVFEHGGRGVPRGYRAAAHAGAARATAGRANAGRGNYGKPGAGHAAAGRGIGGNRSASASRGAAASRGVGSRAATASRGSANSRSGSFPNHAASAGRGSSMANRNASNRGAGSASRGATANRGSASLNRATAGRGSASASRSSSMGTRNASASRGSATANRAANRGTGSGNRGASANRGATANRGAGAKGGSASASRGGAMANRGSASGSHGSSMASRGPAPSAGHPGGGGHTSSGGRGKGR